MVEQVSDNRTDALPEGTDTVIEGAAGTADSDTVTVNNDLIEETEVPEPRGDAERPATGTSSEAGLAERLRSGREKLATQAGERTRGLVGQGLERTAEALANVSRMVGDTAPGLEERLGAEYGDYARRAAGAIEDVANTIAGKDPDELLEDTRDFVRRSPGLAVAGAAIVGFVVARLIKSGLSSERDEEDDRA